MGVVFFCQSCGARFDVPASHAGKKGRCRHCGQVMQVPRAEHLASMTSMPAMAVAGRVAANGVRRTPAEPVAMSAGDWLRTAASSVGLAPLTVDRMPATARAKKQKDDEDWGDSKPYLLADAPRARVAAAGSAAAGAVVRTWQREMRGLQKIFRWIERFAYLVSVPFLIALIAGTVTKSRGLALFGATFVVLLNLARIVSTLATLVIVPLRDGLNTRKMKGPVRRVAEPVLTIAAVVVAFTFIPWLATERSASGTIRERLESEVAGLKQEMKGQIKKTAEEAREIDVQKLGEQAREKLKEIGQTGGDGESPASPPKVPRKSRQDAIDGLIRDVSKKAQETIDAANKP